MAALALARRRLAERRTSRRRSAISLRSSSRCSRSQPAASTAARAPRLCAWIACCVPALRLRRAVRRRAVRGRRRHEQRQPAQRGEAQDAQRAVATVRSPRPRGLCAARPDARRRSERARYGLLEKHKDYKLRAKDFHRKEDAIKARHTCSRRAPHAAAEPRARRRCCATRLRCAIPMSSTSPWRRRGPRTACTWRGVCPEQARTSLACCASSRWALTHGVALALGFRSSGAVPEYTAEELRLMKARLRVVVLRSTRLTCRVALTRSRALQTQDLGYVVHKSQVESKARARSFRSGTVCSWLMLLCLPSLRLFPGRRKWSACRRRCTSWARAPPASARCSWRTGAAGLALASLAPSAGTSA
jgi:hypothetical protein